MTDIATIAKGLMFALTAYQVAMAGFAAGWQQAEDEIEQSRRAHLETNP